LPCTEQDGDIKEYRGLNYIKYGTELNLSDLDTSNAPPKIIINDDEVAKAQNNLVRFFKDPQTREFSHPVVYIENGSHEFYPSENWTYYGSPNHNGKSYHYLTSTPPNLGEIDYPLHETDEADVVLWFNGYWGAYGNYNDPPPGPVLHKNWTTIPLKGSGTNRSNLKLGF
jgi:hypothetical protein